MWYKYVAVTGQISLLACWNKEGLESAASTEVIGKTSIDSTCLRVRCGGNEILFVFCGLWSWVGLGGVGLHRVGLCWGWLPALKRGEEERNCCPGSWHFWKASGQEAPQVEICLFSWWLLKMKYITIMPIAPFWSPGSCYQATRAKGFTNYIVKEQLYVVM